MSNEQQLQDLRARIDELDGQLKMITTRAELAKAVAAAKGGEATDYYRPEREAQLLRKIIARNRGPLSDERRWLNNHLAKACRRKQDMRHRCAFHFVNISQTIRR